LSRLGAATVKIFVSSSLRAIADDPEGSPNRRPDVESRPDKIT